MTETPITHDMGVRRFGRVNWLGLYTLVHREAIRFLAIWPQTVLAPLVTAGLFLLVFNLAIGVHRGEVLGVAYVHFLAPGILMMSVIQNAFTNSASSLVVSKVQGNIVDTLMPPLSPLEIVLGYTLGGVLRGVAVAAAIAIVSFPALGLSLSNFVWFGTFVLLAAALLSLIGVLAGIVSNRFDQMNAISNFIVSPLSFLSGTFYSIDILPSSIRWMVDYNPIFYLIDGARFGVIGASDASPVLGLMVNLVLILLLGFWAWLWLKSGYRLKS